MPAIRLNTREQSEEGAQSNESKSEPRLAKALRECTALAVWSSVEHSYQQLKRSTEGRAKEVSEQYLDEGGSQSSKELECAKGAPFGLEPAAVANSHFLKCHCDQGSVAEAWSRLEKENQITGKDATSGPYGALERHRLTSWLLQELNRFE